jgi:hypothetical protein
MSVIIDGTAGVTFNDASIQNTAATGFGFKNRIINGAMVIDQRNAGASGTAGAYTVDRWFYEPSQATKGTWQQNAGSVTPPTGFSNYLGFTSSSAYSLLSGDYFNFQQKIEGFNFADMAWGTANAQSVTLSFWVRSSLTGTFGGTLRNSDTNYSYPFSYAINSANTWEQKTITIAGPTAGTWVGATNGLGVLVAFSLGTGTTYSGTAGAWAASNLLSATGATSVVGTNGATFYITGVQLEKGSTATSFDYRPYGTELMLCQRYYSRQGIFGRGNISAHVTVPINVNMRTTPSVTTISTFTADGAAYTVYTDAIATNNFDVKITWTGGGSTSAYSAEFGAAAEL